MILSRQNCRGVVDVRRHHDSSVSRFEDLPLSSTIESMMIMASSPAQNSDLDFQDWISRSETAEDVASFSAMQNLQAILEVPTTDADNLFPLGHWLHFTPTAGMSELGEDGHPKLGGFLPPFPFPRRMWVGSRIAYHAPIPLGERITKTTTIESITPKSGRGGELIFLGLRHDIRTGDALALTEHQTIVYREAVPVDPDNPQGPKPPRESAPPEGDWEWTSKIQPNEVTLFRYSAVTFNSHRIHYDLPYATAVEGYPGLVVHGPLSATNIMAHFQQQRDYPSIESFEFTARSPLFANEAAYVCGQHVDETDGLLTEKLALIGPDNTTAVEATIQYRK